VIKEVGMAARVNKKSRKREKQMERVKKTLKVLLLSMQIVNLQILTFSFILFFL